MGKMRFPLVAILFFASAGTLSAQGGFMITTTSLPAATVGVPYSAQLQESGALSTVFWSCVGTGNGCPGMAPGLSLDPNSGAISGTPTAAGSFSFTAQAEFNNSATQTATKGLTINVSTPCSAAISPASLPDGDLDIRYPTVSISAGGCPGVFTFTAQSSSFNQPPLPSGMSLSPTGTLSGTPGKLGTFAFDITANGPNQSTASSHFTITIHPLPSFSTTSPLPNGTVGALYSQQIKATDGTPGASGYIFSMNNNPPGIAISRSGLLSGTPTQGGTFQFNMGVTDSVGGQGQAPFQVSFLTGTPQVQVSPLSLTLNADLQGGSPGTQAISVVAANGVKPPVNFSVLVDNGPSTTAASLQSRAAAPSWISVSPTSAVAPAGLVIHVDQGTMPAGAYPARIRILDGNNFPTDIAVTLNVNNTPQQLNVATPLLRFGASMSAPGTLVEDLLVTNTGAGTVPFTTSVVGGSSWITGITPSSGQTVRDAPVFLHVQVSTNGLPVGSYHDIIRVASSAGNVDIPTSLFVASSGPVLAVNTTGTLFLARKNGGSSAQHDIEILNIGDSSSTVNWTATLVSGSDWLNLVSSSGTATPASPGTLTLALLPNATQLALGPHYALVKIVDPNSLDSPQFVSAVLDLEPESAAPAPDVAPAGLYFATPAGGAAPPAQKVLINTSSNSPVPFQAATTTTDQGTWLHATPATGNTSGPNPGALSISVDPTALAAGIYTGNVNVSISQLLESVNVTFVVLPASASNAFSRLRPEAAGCIAGKLAITETGLANNFAVPAGWPATLIAQLNNDCGSLVTDGSLVASFSNGDAPLALVGDSLGNYSATWQPGAVNSEMVVTLNATAGTLRPATATLHGGIAQNQTPPPTLASGGTLNNLNPVAGESLSPGVIAQVYGSGLAASPVSTGVLPLPTIFDNTFALVGATQAPLYFLSSGQLNVQIPNELVASQQVPILLSVNNALTLPLTLDIVPTAPGVLSLFDGPKPPSTQNGAHIIAQHSDFTLVNSKNPAKPKEFLVMYLVGLGATDPAVPSGAPAPSATLAKVTHQPTVTVGSLPAKVLFAGLTPGFVGLYQINFQVPAGVASGDIEVDVTQNGVAANPTKLPVHP
jgi:uncharacterized protein (TIGR03437 family)